MARRSQSFPQRCHFNHYHSTNLQIHICFFFQYASPDALASGAASYRITAGFWCSARFQVATMESFESAPLTFCSR